MGTNAVRKLKWRFSRFNRRRKVVTIRRYVRAHGIESVLFVGSARRVEADGAVEDGIAADVRVVGACDITRSVSPWPFVVADGRTLPFRTKSVDLIVSNAVIEHVGDEADQRRFMEEIARVGRHWIVTTPNRWFPVESHTNAIFKHWSARWRDTQANFTRLLSRREFAELLPPGSRVLGHGWSPTFMASGRCPDLSADTTSEEVRVLAPEGSRGRNS